MIKKRASSDCLFALSQLGGRAPSLARRAFVALAALAVFMLVPSVAHAQAKPGWTLTFDDEFSETSLDTTKWGTFYKWGQAPINGELEAYVTDAFTFSNGVMSIHGTDHPGTYAGQTFQYRSGLIASVFEQQFGYFEMRAKLPAGQGFWPAFWLLHDPSAPDVNEIDIFEVLAQSTTTLYTTNHWGTSYATDNHQDQKVSTVADMSTDFHVYGLEWDSRKLVWYFDGAAVHTYTGAGIPQVPMYIIANLAIGGSWPGPPNASTVFPGLFQIDYVRAYASDDGGVPRDAGAADSASVDTGAVDSSVRGDGGASGSSNAADSSAFDIDAGGARGAVPFEDAQVGGGGNAAWTPGTANVSCAVGTGALGGSSFLMAVAPLFLVVAAWLYRRSRLLQRTLSR